MSKTFIDTDWAAFRAKRPEFASVETVWREALEPELARRDVTRAKAVKDAITFTAIGAFVAIVVLIIIGMFLPFSPFVMFLAFAGCALGVGVFSAMKWAQVFSAKTQTKELILGVSAEAFGFTYNTLHPDMSGISSFKDLASRMKTLAKEDPYFHSARDGKSSPTPAMSVLEEARLLPSYDKARFEDLITGTRAGTDFSLVEAKLTEQQGSGKNRRTVTVFQGILVHIAYPERFLGRTVLARSGWWKRGRNSRDLQKVQLVSVELDRAFTVYSTDQVEARTLLTPDKMERLILLEQFFRGGKLRGIFEGDHLTVALEAPDQFEGGSVFKTLVDDTRYKQALHEMGLICDLIDGFLTREWAAEKRT